MQTKQFWAWVLLMSVIVSSLLVVKVRHQHRLAYLEYHKQSQDRDALSDEWGQLLIEQNLWSSSHRIEKHASEQLNMRAPMPSEIQLVSDDQDVSQLAEVSHGSR